MISSQLLPYATVEALARWVHTVASLMTLAVGVEYSVGVAEFDDGRIEITLTPVASEVT
jgi:hypothetical protein